MVTSSSPAATLSVKMELLSSEEIERRLAGSAWRQEGGAIVREFQFPDFKAALRFVNRVGEAAESANHHPDILLHSYNRVRITLSTHSAGGVTEADFNLAAELDRLA
jgi:4a-hydroxytetrahydrobiopterin dehydratase